jgi:hypothetical protein
MVVQGKLEGATVVPIGLMPGKRIPQVPTFKGKGCGVWTTVHGANVRSTIWSLVFECSEPGEEAYPYHAGLGRLKVYATTGKVLVEVVDTGLGGCWYSGIRPWNYSTLHCDPGMSTLTHTEGGLVHNPLQIEVVEGARM